MKPEARKYLYDIWRAVELLREFTADKTFADYEHDAMLRAAVERQFEIIGEATARLARLDQELAGRIGEYRRIVAFRNILIHGYADVDDRLVWDVVEAKLPILRRDVAGLLRERGSSRPDPGLACAALAASFDISVIFPIESGPYSSYMPVTHAR